MLNDIRGVSFHELQRQNHFCATYNDLPPVLLFSLCVFPTPVGWAQPRQQQHHAIERCGARSLTQRSTLMLCDSCPGLTSYWRPRGFAPQQVPQRAPVPSARNGAFGGRSWSTSPSLRREALGRCTVPPGATARCVAPTPAHCPAKAFLSKQVALTLPAHKGWITSGLCTTTRHVMQAASRTHAHATPSKHVHAMTAARRCEPRKGAKPSLPPPLPHLGVIMCVCIRLL